MFGIPIIIWETLGKLAFSLLVTAAQKAGVINGLEAAAIRAEHDAISAIQNLKTYSAPSDFPEAPPATPTPNNLQPQKVQ